MSMTRGLRIGDVARRTGLSPDTLRYYERIGLLAPVAREDSGIRRYDEDDLARLRFIQRAKAMRFSLDEIARLLALRADPAGARDDTRTLAERKLAEVEARLRELDALRRALDELVRQCRGAAGRCPIIERLDDEATACDNTSGS